MIDPPGAVRCRFVFLGLSVDLKRLYRHLRQDWGIQRDGANWAVLGAAMHDPGSGRVLQGPPDGTVRSAAAALDPKESP